MTGKQPQRLPDDRWEYPPPGGGDDGGRVGGGGDMYNSDTEHSRAIYCDEASSGAVLGGGSKDGRYGIKTVVGAGGNKLGWNMSGDRDGSRYGGGV